jgi:hypothetical protein
VKSDDFLNAFFAPPNRLRRDSDPRLQAWIRRLEGDSPRASVLPRWLDGTRVVWYGLAFDDREFRALGEDLTAFVGPTYTTFRGQRVRLDLDDPIEAAAAKFTGGLVYKFEGDAAQARPAENVWKALERMRGTWERRKVREQAMLLPLSRLLRDFFMAVQAGNTAVVDTLLEQLQFHPQLDAVNRLFLQVQANASLGRWGRLLEASPLADLMQMRRPLAVTAALIEAVYRRLLEPFEEEGDPAGAARRFRDEILPQFGPLYASRGWLRSSGVLKSFMLLAVTTDPPRLDLRDEILALPDIGERDRAYLRRLAGLVPAPPSTSQPPLTAPVLDPEADATRAVQAGDYDRAVLLLRDRPASLARARLLCEIAFELDALQFRTLAVEAVNVLSEADREQFLSRRVHRRLWEQLQPESAAQPPDQLATVPAGWTDWLELLSRPAEWARARRLARQGAEEWGLEELRNDPAAVNRLADGIRYPTAGAEDVVRESLPHLLAFFQKDDRWPANEFREVYLAMTDQLYLSTRGGDDDLTLFNELFDALLRIGLKEEEYRALVDQALELWRKYQSAELSDWLVNLLAVLTRQRCPDAARRRAVLEAALVALQRMPHRVDPEQRDLILTLAREQSEEELALQYLPLVPAPAGRVDPLTALNEMSVAIYTLTESAAVNAQQILERLYPRTRVSLVHDLDCSKRLQQLARQTDLFVMVSASSKHAATECIEQHRSHDLPLLRPRGRGSASILRAIREHLSV